MFPLWASTVICFQWETVLKGCTEKVEFWKLWVKRLHLLSEGGRRREICQRCQLYSSHQSEAPKHTSKTPEGLVHQAGFRLEEEEAPPETSRPSSYQKQVRVPFNSTFKTVLKVLRWSVVQISVFAVAQVLTSHSGVHILSPQPASHEPPG